MPQDTEKTEIPQECIVSDKTRNAQKFVAAEAAKKAAQGVASTLPIANPLIKAPVVYIAKQVAGYGAAKLMDRNADLHERECAQNLQRIETAKKEQEKQQAEKRAAQVAAQLEADRAAAVNKRAREEAAKLAKRRAAIAFTNSMNAGGAARGMAVMQQQRAQQAATQQALQQKQNAATAKNHAKTAQSQLTPVQPFVPILNQYVNKSINAPALPSLGSTSPSGITDMSVTVQSLGQPRELNAKTMLNTAVASGIKAKL